MANVVECSKAGDVWPTNKNDYHLGKVIGTGSIAIVHIANCIPRNEVCAVKRVNLKQFNIKFDQLKEIEALIACNHKNIIKYFTYFVVEEELWLVAKLLESGSLLGIINNYAQTEECKDGLFNESIVATVLRKVLRGLIYLHKNGYIHRNIKAENILINKYSDVQMTGFGLSAWLAAIGASRDDSKQIIPGAQYRMAPEVRETTQKYDFKTDIWDFAVAAVELATGMNPTVIIQRHSSILEFVSGESFKYKKYGKLMREMIANCLKIDPQKRPSAAELLKHSFFKKAKNKKCLVQTLLPFAPPIELRILRIINVNRLPESNRWRYQTDGDNWTWLPVEERTC